MWHQWARNLNQYKKGTNLKLFAAEKIFIQEDKRNGDEPVKTQIIINIPERYS